MYCFVSLKKTTQALLARLNSLASFFLVHCTSTK
jgi:hypothetical protein